ncbi:hypothetical protein ASPTUDRAFT_54690 [Aspergillus tubingensis CBS 134.48]|uniref:Methyltransferase LaeA n=1 Tax=Aspergillus tubingensis (strain CBS 134.48) TaxID=767770 RepID=A0A1L9N740_ASPTC|nr:hypothetical protein ASPTUDRAFT_54690 [Aspergillus tubingensis CBS 134.48]
MASPNRNNYSYQGLGSYDSGRSRQNSGAMDIHVLTGQEPPREPPPNDDPYDGHGGPDQTSRYTRWLFYEENGRTYHGYRRGVYPLPCDEEEQDRLDIFHKLFTVARIWAIDVAHKYPNAFVAGVDLAPIQPPNHPDNCEFYAPFDFEAPWTLGENSWDLIHLQMGSGSVLGWPNLYKRILRHLQPGAWFEQVEIDFEPRCDDRSLDGLALREWYQYLKQATQDTMRPIAHSSRDTIRHLEEAGFTQIDHQMVGLPLNPWHHDEHEKKVARWYNLAISESIETLSLAPFSRIFHWDLERIRQITAEVKSQAFNKEIHAYNILHIYQARKPGGPSL